MKLVMLVLVIGITSTLTKQLSWIQWQFHAKLFPSTVHRTYKISLFIYTTSPKHCTWKNGFKSQTAATKPNIELQQSNLILNKDHLLTIPWRRATQVILQLQNTHNFRPSLYSRQITMSFFSKNSTCISTAN